MGIGCVEREGNLIDRDAEPVGELCGRRNSAQFVGQLAGRRADGDRQLFDRPGNPDVPTIVVEVLLEPAIDDSSGVGRKANFSFGIETVDGVDQRLEGDLLEIVVAPGAGVSPGERDCSP